MRRKVFVSLSVIFLLVTRPTIVRAQDTLSSTTPGYANILDDWKDQDKVTATSGYRSAITAIIVTLPASAEKDMLQARLTALAGEPSTSPAMEQLYVRTCSARRAMRMAAYTSRFEKIVFSQHRTRGGLFFADSIFCEGGYEGKGLELLTMNKYYGSLTHLLATGVARDPDVSFDGKRILFTWRGGTSGATKYHLFEMDVATKAIRQITTDFSGLSGYPWGVIDYQGIYLPNGNILFNSTRHVQHNDCFSVCMSNYFICDKNGKYIRRLCYDQANTDDAQVLPDGRIVYSRWDYNDKSHTYGHALFVMKPDGTEQREYCNNNSWWPTMILQQRPIPGTTKLMAMLGGYHTPREGKIGIIDINRGNENGAGITLLAPVRLPKDDNLDQWGGVPSASEYPFTLDWSMFPRPGARPLDTWGQGNPKFAYPYPFDENTFLVSFRPTSKSSAWSGRFGLFFMLADGQRELLYYDPAGSCMAAVALAPRVLPPVLSSKVDYRETTGTFQLLSVYDPRCSDSPLLQGIDPKIIKRLRVAGLEYRSGPMIGTNAHFGAGAINYGGAGYHTPVSVGSACWDAKIIYGETPVLSDGSVNITVPARTPLYFQLLDSVGNVIQTMRSWTMVQPGETFACMGCHESKINAPPPLTYVPLAIQQPPVALTPFYGPARGFSFAKEIQPIFDSKCISCHNTSKPNGIDLTGVKVWNGTNAKNWLRSYSNLVNHAEKECFTKYVSWFPAEDSPILQPPYRTGACKSPLVTRLAAGHSNLTMTKEEMDKIRCWIDLGIPHSGTYTEGMSAADSTKTANFLAYRRAWEVEERKNIQDYIGSVGTIHGSDFYKVKKTQQIQERWTLAAWHATSKTIRVVFTVPVSFDREPVRMSLYNLRGEIVATLMNERVTAGYHARSYQVPATTGAGHYLVQIKTKEFEKAAAVVIVK